MFVLPPESCLLTVAYVDQQQQQTLNFEISLMFHGNFVLQIIAGRPLTTKEQPLMGP